MSEEVNVNEIDPMAELDQIRTREKALLTSIEAKQQELIDALEDTCRLLGKRLPPERLSGVLPIKKVRGPRKAKPVAVPPVKAKK